MTTDRWEQIKRLFHESLKHEPAQRSAFLERVCDGDKFLRSEVESLLVSHMQADSFIETPASDVAAALLAEDQAELAAGQMLHNFKVLTVLATGGMGQVYLADDTRLGRKVALKLLPPRFTVDSDRVHRFEREARAASALNHPNIVTIHEIGQTDSIHFIATEFVDGETLREHITNTRMTVGEVLDVAIQVASALQAAHEAGIVHRDIKPENIMLRRDGLLKVLDFGLAKLATQQMATVGADYPTAFRVKTNPGVIMGTVAYMSPEQARGEEVDERTDLWSLGIILYEMVAGCVPFDGQTPSHVIVSILESKLPLLSLDPEVPAELNRIVTKALCKEKSERYQTAAAMTLDLKELKEALTAESRLRQFRGRGANGGQAPSNGLFGPPETIGKPIASTVLGRTRQTLSAEYLVRKIKRHKLYVGAAVLVLFVGAIGVIYSVINRTRTDPADPDRKSIAVLAFKPTNASDRDDIYEIAIADALIGRLSSRKSLVVRHLSATLEYRNLEQDPIATGKELQVDYVLATNYQLIDGKIRIIARLFNVTTGVIQRTYQIDKDSNLVLASRDQIAAEVESNLLAQFATDSNRRTATKGTSNEEAYRFYVHGKNLTNKRSAKDALEAVKNFEDAIKLDPNFARAYAAMAEAYRALAILGGGLPREQFEKAKEAVTKALQIDNSLADAYSARGDLKHKYERDWVGAEKDFLTALELEPNNDLAHAQYAILLGEWGRFDEGMAEIDAALAIDPRSLVYQRDRGRILYFARRYDEAIVQLKRVVELNANFTTAYSWLWSAYEMKGDYARAYETIINHQKQTNLDRVEVYQKAYETAGWLGVKRKRLELSKFAVLGAYNIAKQCAVLGETEEAFDYLNRAIERREGPAGMLRVEPVFDILRGDPRFNELIKRIGL